MRLVSAVLNAETSIPPASPEARILVIEDNADDQAILIHQLQKSGVNDPVVCIGDGNDALKFLGEGARKLSAVCAIFLDLSLPGVDGLLLLKAIRSNLETALLPVFVISGSTNPKDEAEAKRLGATSFLSKQKLSLPSFRATIGALFAARQPDADLLPR